MFPLFIIVGWHVVQNHRTQSQIQPRTNYSQFGILLETGPQSAAIESSIYGDQLRWMRFSRNDSNRTYGNILDRDRFYLHSSPEWISDHWFKWVENTSLTGAFIIRGITKCNQLWRRAYPVIDKWQFACICMQPNSPAQSPLGARVGTGHKATCTAVLFCTRSVRRECHCRYTYPLLTIRMRHDHWTHCSARCLYRFLC